MDRKFKRGFQVSGIILAGAVSLSAADPETVGRISRQLEEKSVRLDSLRAELNRGKKRLASLGKKEGTYLEQINQIEHNIHATRLYLDGLNQQIDSTADRIDSLSGMLAQAERSLERRQEIMKRRLRAMYKTGRFGVREILTGVTDISQLLHRALYFRRLIWYDRLLLRKIDSTKNFIRLNRQREQVEHERLALLRRGKEQEQAALENRQESRQSLLRKVRSEKKAWLAVVREYEAAQKELASVISLLHTRKETAQREYERTLKIAFEKRRGKLPWPVAGAVVREFGRIRHPVYKTVIANDGIDIQAPQGDEIRSVAPGRVRFVSWQRGYGKMVVLDHGGGYFSIYTHCQDILVRKDQDVEGFSPVATVGQTGMVDAPRLHFEIRSSEGAVDPREWLEKRTEGAL